MVSFFLKFILWADVDLLFSLSFLCDRCLDFTSDCSRHWRRDSIADLKTVKQSRQEHLWTQLNFSATLKVTCEWMSYSCAAEEETAEDNCRFLDAHILPKLKNAFRLNSEYRVTSYTHRNQQLACVLGNLHGVSASSARLHPPWMK